MTRRGSSFHPLLWLSLAALAVLAAVVLTSPLQVILDYYLHDDSFYYLKTAENLARGYGSTFDTINSTNGYHPAWLVILAALYWVGVGHDQMVSVALVMQALTFGAGLVMLTRTLAQMGLRPVFAAAATGLVYVGLLPAIGFNLLECGLTVLTSSLVMWALNRQLEGPRLSLLWFGLALSAAALARTDHLVFLAIGGAVFGWQLVFNHRRNQWFGEVSRFAAPVMLLVGAYLATNILTTGHAMQVSGLVKLYLSQLQPATVLADFVRPDVRGGCWKLGALAAICILARDARGRRPSGVGLYALGGLVIAAYYQLNYDIGFNYAFWYYIPLDNLFCYAVALVMQRAAASIESERPWLVAVGLAAALTVVFAIRIDKNYGYRRLTIAERGETYLAALTMRARTQPEDRIAAWDAGVLGYFGERRVINLDGLINSTDYFERYISLGRTADYIRESGFEYVACVASDVGPTGRAAPILDRYTEAFRDGSWVFLKRNR